jgi:outer membrane protein assembly factor BamB
MTRYFPNLLLLLLGTTCFAAPIDWPQWQGPDRDATSKETGLLKQWPKEGPPLAWEVKGLGGGYNEPSIVGGRIYGMSLRDGKEVVWARSETDGKAIWETPIGQPPSQRMPQGSEGPGCTPTVDGDRVYVISNGGEVACLGAGDGKVFWHHSMIKDFGGSPPGWSYRESPLIDGEKMICTPGAADAGMVALNKLTGETIWKSKIAADSGAGSGRRGRGGGSLAGYASAIAIDFDGRRQYVQFAGKTLVGVDAVDGKLLWHYDKPANAQGINCATPIFHDGMVFASSAYGAGGGVVKLGKDAGGGIKAEEVWFSRNMQNHHGGVILYKGCLYGANGGNGGGAMVCLDFATGNVLWNQRSEGRAPKGSILLADDRFYYRSEDGTMLLIEPNSKQYVELGRFEQPDRSSAPDWSHPVIANGKLYLRDQDVLLCYDVKAK